MALRARIDAPLARKIAKQARLEQVPESQIVRRILRAHFAGENGGA